MECTVFVVLVVWLDLAIDNVEFIRGNFRDGSVGIPGSEHLFSIYTNGEQNKEEDR